MNSVGTAFIDHSFVEESRDGHFPMKIDFSVMLPMLTALHIVGSSLIARRRYGWTLLYFTLAIAPRFWNFLVMIYLLISALVMGKNVYLG